MCQKVKNAKNTKQNNQRKIDEQKRRRNYQQNKMESVQKATLGAKDKIHLKYQRPPMARRDNFVACVFFLLLAKQFRIGFHLRTLQNNALGYTMICESVFGAALNYDGIIRQANVRNNNNNQTFMIYQMREPMNWKRNLKFICFSYRHRLEIKTARQSR